MRLLAAALLLAASTATASAACDVKGAKLEEAIAGKTELRESANKQTVRDLRTLRDAAIVLETYKYEAECERLVAIVRALAANPEKTIERGGDTDEEKAEDLMEAREPKAPVVPDTAKPK
ncbi:photosystem reaction center subunit H [Methylobacterium sp.]|jgi:Spy/CpxP family protein refolding chaperone|uniref:photosystem reaction center subunit H n=1 Tax=Methylobacterium sp. TaxID=409 RepID=UPI002603F76A|nr:photosystem reaction center subunit H [Methylobacterium sp.]MDB5646431.1 photosystem reaction center subunit [Methylobacterium sp.]